MENSKNVQLHEIIKNSLATYLSYKWSDDKLYLKKRKKKPHKHSSDKEKKRKSSSLERQHSIINLENDVFIYDAKSKTFTQLDLCDCFKNGVKYRRSDPFEPSKSKKKKYELCELAEKKIEEYQTYQIVNVEDAVNHIFNNKELVDRDTWRKNMNSLVPSKFDLFIQRELNKCTGRNFNVKSFKINAKPEVGSTSKHQVCSSAAIGYYTITTYDNGLQCGNPNGLRAITTKALNTRGYSIIDVQKDSYHPKKMYSKGLQCKRSSASHQVSKKEKGVVTNQTAEYNTHHVTREARSKEKSIEYRNKEIVPQSKKSSPTRQKQRIHKKQSRKKHSSLSDLFPTSSCDSADMIQINSSAEIRKIVNETLSTATFSLSTTGEYFRTFLSPHPMMTYYHASSTSREYRYDVQGRYNDKVPSLVVARSIPCHAQNWERDRQLEQVRENVCSCKCADRISPRNQTVRMDRPEIHMPRSIACPYLDQNWRQEKYIDQIRENSCTCACDSRKNQAAVIESPKLCGCSHCTKQKSSPNKCQHCCKEKEEKQVCVREVKKKVCCSCVKDDKPCICDILFNLRDRIKRQTDEQNQHLNQILEELNKQDQEIKEIRQYVEKSKRNFKKCCVKKPKVCTCYTATMQYDFTTDLAPLPDLSTQKVYKKRKRELENKDKIEPELIQIFGADKTLDVTKPKTDSWKSLWSSNKEVKAFFINDFFKKCSSVQQKVSTSSNSNHLAEQKKNRTTRKYWFTKLFTSKRDLRIQEP